VLRTRSGGKLVLRTRSGGKLVLRTRSGGKLVLRVGKLRSEDTLRKTVQYDVLRTVAHVLVLRKLVGRSSDPECRGGMGNKSCTTNQAAEESA
jgi:hypothetical protein